VSDVVVLPPELARHRPGGHAGPRFDRWVAWLWRWQPAQLPIEAYRVAKLKAREGSEPPRTIMNDTRLREVLQAAEDETVDVALGPFLSMIARLGWPAVAAYAARRIVPMLDLIPLSVRSYAFGAIAAAVVLAGAALDAAGWNINVAEILIVASPAIGAQIIALRNRIGADGKKTYFVAGGVLVVSGAAIAGILTGHGAVVVPVAGPILTLLIGGAAPATLTQAAVKASENPVPLNLPDQKGFGAFDLLVAILVACCWGLILTVPWGCSPGSPPAEVSPEPTALPTPEGCEPSRMGSDGECRGISSGRITLPECCGLPKGS
jgi:hypothetical protein